MKRCIAFAPFFVCMAAANVATCSGTGRGNNSCPTGLAQTSDSLLQKETKKEIIQLDVSQNEMHSRVHTLQGGQMSEELEVQPKKNEVLINMDLATNKSDVECIAASVSATTDVAGIFVQIKAVDEFCKSNDAEACAKKGLILAEMFTALGDKIMNTLVIECNGGLAPEGLQCAKDASSFIATLTETAKMVVDTIAKCKDIIDPWAKMKCVGPTTWISEATRIGVGIADIVSKCQRGCVVASERQACSAPCTFDGATYSGEERVRWVVGNTHHDLRGAILQVNEDCCSSSLCSEEEFPDLSSCDNSCTFMGLYKPCKGRVQWLVDNQNKSVGDAVTQVNEECKTQCSCVISDIP